MSILSERRAFQPYGLEGGSPGQRGLNLLTFAADQRSVNLGGKSTVAVLPGDKLTIHTPGGGGYGFETSSQSIQQKEIRKGSAPFVMASGSLNQYRLNQESV